MSGRTIEEVCPCGASIRTNGSEFRSFEGGGRNVNNPRGAEEVVERWRVEHKHVEPPATERVPVKRLPLYVSTAKPRRRA